MHPKRSWSRAGPMGATRICAAVLVASTALSAQPDAGRPLVAKTPIERQIAAREKHGYTVDASAGQLLRLEMGQDAIDLIVRVTEQGAALVAPLLLGRVHAPGRLALIPRRSGAIARPLPSLRCCHFAERGNRHEG